MSYADVILDDSPLAYWAMDESSGTTLADSSGNSRALTTTGTPTLGRPKIRPVGGTSTGFDTDDSDKASVAHGAWMNTSAYTLECWLRPVYKSTWQNLVCRGVAGSGFAGYSFMLAVYQLTPSVYFYDSTMGLGGVAYYATLTAGEPYHIAAVWDPPAGWAGFYLNGTLVNEYTAGYAQTANTPTAPIDVGMWGASGKAVGDLSDVAVYGTALSPTRIAAHYAAGFGPGPRGGFTFAGAAEEPTVVPAPVEARADGVFTFTTGVDTAGLEQSYTWGAAEVTYLALSTNADLELRVSPDPIPDGVDFRSDLSVVLTMPEPAVVLGRPVLPDWGWARPEMEFATGPLPLVVVTKPPPPVPKIETRPVTPPGGGDYGHLVWHTGYGLGGEGSRPTSWPADPAWGEWPTARPAFNSNSFYAPTVGTQAVWTSAGAQTLQDKALIFNYGGVQHMWTDIGMNITGPFTWMLCAIILSYPTARYGHYLIDHGGDPGRNAVTYGFTGQVGGEGDHRSAMLFQRHSALVGTTYPTIETGPYARCEHNYTPQPRLFYGIFNGSSSFVGVMGRNYARSARGAVLAKTHRRFVMGRRNSYTSTDLASHIAVFEAHYVNHALSGAELQAQYDAMSARYDFDKYLK